VNFDITNQLLIRFSAFVRYWRKIGVQWGSTSVIHKLQKAYDSVRREVLYNILTEFGVPIHVFK
jgi:hypothetical protein